MRPLSDTVFIGRQLQHFERLDSTNRFLKDLVAGNNPLPEGLVVIADEQFAGKGQLGAAWITEPGMNLTCSILLKPGFLSPQQVFYLNKAVALGVRDAVAGQIQYEEVTIKWPNDIYIGRKKVAGILVENGLSNAVVQYSIVGIGVNVNQGSFDPEIPNPVSMSQAAGRKFELQPLLDEICSSVEHYYFLLRGLDFKRVDDIYHTHLFGFGRQLKFRSDGHTFLAEVRGVDTNGKLILLINDETKCFEVKEIAWLL